MTASATTRDQSGGSFVMATASLGGLLLGPGTALVDEDVLRLLRLDSPTGEKALQFRHESIAAVTIGDGSVVVSLRDSRQLVVTTIEASALRARLLGACRALPEVTRALRALGSRRGLGGRHRHSSDKQTRFFAPFIAARRAAMEARDAATVISSFDARRLGTQLSATIAVLAAEQSGGHPARRRALEAELGDSVEPLSVALTALEDLAIHGASNVDDLDRWRSWAAGVQGVFEAADRSWLVIEPIVSA